MLGFHFSKTPAKTTKNLCYFSTLTNWSAGPSGGGGGGAPKASPPPPYVLRDACVHATESPQLINYTITRDTPRETRSSDGGRSCVPDSMQELDAVVAQMQEQQIQMNGRVTLALMERVQARASIAVKGKAIALVYPHVMVHMEAKTEKLCGGYVMEPHRDLESLSAMNVLKRDDLPQFREARRYAEQQLADTDLKIGSRGDRRLQLTPLNHTSQAVRSRVDRIGTPLLASQPTLDGTVVLLAQGELDAPCKLDRLKSFFVELVTCHGDKKRLGPFSDTRIMRKFNEDCKQRKAYFRAAADGRTAEIRWEKLVAPMKVSLDDDDGNRLVVALVRYEGSVCLLGVSFAFTVDMQDAPPITECAVCLEECASDEWACVHCRNLLHHTCRRQTVNMGMAQCPYCRFEE